MLAQIILSLSLIIIAIYGLVIWRIRGHWQTSATDKAPPNFISEMGLSIVVAARNEEKNIIPCIESILNSKFPRHRFELIIVNDHSEDLTENLILAKYKDQVVFINQETGKAGKKEAIAVGVARAKFPIIITTDADCIVGEEWIRTMAWKAESTKAKFVAAPVTFNTQSNFLQWFQAMDFFGTMAITKYGIDKGLYYMANGANMAFRKAAFTEAGGYADNKDIASGDDMFLVQKIAKQYSGGVHFLKSQRATVVTTPVLSWLDFLRQRKRWAAKSKAYEGKSIFFILGLAFCVSLVFALLLGAIFLEKSFYLCLGTILFIFLKVAIDIWFLREIARFFDKQPPMSYLILGSFTHILHILYSGLVGLFGSKTNWKGRSV